MVKERKFICVDGNYIDIDNIGFLVKEDDEEGDYIINLKYPLIINDASVHLFKITNEQMTEIVGTLGVYQISPSKADPTEGE